MIIKEMFLKKIDRDIKGVIKIGQSDEENIRQELEEYVVTRELQRHFADFFSSYKRGINGHTDKMGVWISGFFGSGKSHFLKILSYLLDNREVDGRRAIDYFIEGDKIADPMVLADMRLAASIPTDVVLFNIDSKSDVVGNKAKDAIVSVFLKVFNEMQGFSGSNPYLADLERQLTKDGLYDGFKETFNTVYGTAWEASRHKFGFIQDKVVEALVSIGFMSEAAARNWCEKTVNPYAISIADFVRLVKEYMDNQAPNHHLVFLVDEMGQYIGEDSNLMLNLQTLTEDLGVACRGKVWIIVTSQQDIDSVTKVKGNDFSKIQGRFDTRLSLSSANVDEVIRKRILAKELTAEQTLRLTYEQKATIIKNLITFHDRVEKKLYADADDFSAVYPFIPYQFNLLGDVLTSIRTHGATGKHLSEGERSMLALFQESAKTVMDKCIGPLVPFNVFYDALYNFLDHSHKVVIDRAWENSHVNPEKREDCFTVNVLKVLFMIKYVNQVESNLENITSLMIPHIDTDRIALRAEVERALDVLVRQKFVEREGDLYVFLTNEEQEISREIDKMPVEMSDVISKVAQLIFEEAYKERRYRYPAHSGRYSFAFNQLIDDYVYKGNQSNDIGVHVLTPNAAVSNEEMALRMMSGQGQEVLVVLPNDVSFLNELRSALKIENYLQRESMASNTAQRFAKIREAKRSEMNRRDKRGLVALVDALREADIYVNGDKLETSAKDVGARINEALGKLVSTVYHKLPYVDTAMNEADIRSLFEPSAQQKLDVSGATSANAHALTDVLAFIANNSANHVKTSMKTLMDRFMRAPYGFVEADVEWLVAKLFKDGDIALTLNGESITPLNRTPDELVRYLTKKEFVDKLMTERREKASEHQKRIVREVMKALFDTTSIHDDDDALMNSFQAYAKNMLYELDRLDNMYHSKPLPGKEVVATGKVLLREALQLDAPMEFFKKIPANRNNYLDFADDYEPLKAFLAGEQKVLFETALELMAIYDDSESYIVNRQLEHIVREIKSILSMDLPYSAIPRLPSLIKNFRNTYSQLLADMAEPILAIIEAARKRVLEELDTKVYRDKYRVVYNEKFAEIEHKAKTCNNVATLQSTRLEADAMKVRLLNEMNLLDAQEAKRVAENGTAPDPVVRKTISIKTVTPQISWQIENPEDLERYISTLKERILRELRDNTILNIEF